MHPLDLGSPDLTRTLLRTGLPAMGDLALNAAHQSVDGAFLGHLGTEALAAVSLALPLAGVTAALGVGLGVGTATAIARRLGAGQLDEAGRIASAAMALCLCLSVVAMLALMLGRGVLLDLLGASGTVRAPAEAYLLLMAISAGLGIVQILCDFVAIGEGNARFSLISLALCFGLNIALDPWFIFGFGWGVSGAAAATILSQVITLGLYAWYFATRHGQVLLRPHFDWRGLGPVLRVGALKPRPCWPPPDRRCCCTAWLRATMASRGWPHLVSSCGWSRWPACRSRAFALGRKPCWPMPQVQVIPRGWCRPRADWRC